MVQLENKAAQQLSALLEERLAWIVANAGTGDAGQDEAAADAAIAALEEALAPVLASVDAAPDAAPVAVAARTVDVATVAQRGPVAGVVGVPARYGAGAAGGRWRYLRTRKVFHRKRVLTVATPV